MIIRFRTLQSIFKYSNLVIQELSVDWRFEIDFHTLNEDDGLTASLDFMKLKPEKDNIQVCRDKYKDFKQCKRFSGQKVADFIVQFEQKYNRILKKKIMLPQEILCFELIGNASIGRSEQLLVLFGIDFDNRSSKPNDRWRSLKEITVHRTNRQQKQ